MITLKIPSNTPDPARTRAARRRLRREAGGKIEEPITVIKVYNDGKEEILQVYGPGRCI